MGIMTLTLTRKVKTMTEPSDQSPKLELAKTLLDEMTAPEDPNKQKFHGTWKLDDPDEQKKLSQADKLVLLVQTHDPILFHDQTQTPYAHVNINGVGMTLPLRSTYFKTWVAGLLWTKEEKVPGTQAVYSALNVLCKMAYEGPTFKLWNRAAPSDNGGFWLDMCDDKWRAIQIDRDGWRVVDNPPILFKRYSHQLPLVDPKAGGDAWKLLDFMNIKSEDRLSVLCTVVSYLNPLIPHPILALYGHQGCAKSFMLRLIRRAVDPSVTELIRLPFEERERVQQLEHHYLAYYDNVTWLSSSASDTLCCAATGGGFTKRVLYTDDDDIIYEFRRCVGFNGINIAGTKGDLLDRSLLIQLLAIGKDKRREERRILTEFDKARPEILGGILDAMVNAIKNVDTIELDGLFRMADFTRWGAAIAVALGKTVQDFVSGYEAKVNMQTVEAIYASPVGACLLDWLATRLNYDGSPTELYQLLKKHAETIGISTNQKRWPKAPEILSRDMNELAVSFKAVGYDVAITRSGAQRKIRISSVTAVTGDTPQLPHDASDASDGTLPSFTVLPNKTEGRPSEPNRLDPKVSMKSEGCEGSEASEGSTKAQSSEEPPTIQEILDKLTPEMRGPFEEKQLVNKIIALGFSQAEAQKRVDHFKIKEIISHDDIGNWYFRS